MKSCFLGCVLITLLSLTKHATGADWPEYLRSSQHAGWTEETLDPLHLRLAWQAPHFVAQAVIVGGSAIGIKQSLSSGDDTVVTKWDLATGAIQWQFVQRIAAIQMVTVRGTLVFFQGERYSDQANFLYALDLYTGRLLGKAQIPSFHVSSPAPAVYEIDPELYMVYVSVPTSGSDVFAVRVQLLRPSSRTPLRMQHVWTGHGDFGFSWPTIAGHSVIVAGSGESDAFDLFTGQRNMFRNHTGGGGESCPVYDESRHRLYVLAGPGLIAYDYYSNADIRQRWQFRGAGIDTAGGLSLGADGRVYAADRNAMVVIDPDTGLVLQQVFGSFAVGQTPITSPGYVYVMGETEIFVYSTVDFHLVARIHGSRGSLNTVYDAVGAVVNGAFVIYQNPGFLVYVQT